MAEVGQVPLEHVILVAFVVEGGTREEAHQTVLRDIPGAEDLYHARPYINSWWVAEDDRPENSDGESAIFVHKGFQPEASTVLVASGLSDDVIKAS